MKSFVEIKMIEKKNKQRWLKVNSNLTEDSGIYVLTRHEDGIKYGYVGQAKNILTRLAGHLRGYQHIDLSLKKHGLYSKQNQTGWDVAVFHCPLDKLDYMEQYYIKRFSNLGYQLRNKTSGSQSNGKKSIVDNQSTKGFRDGIKQGYEKARKEIAYLFDKYLDVSIKGKDNKIKQRMLERFKDFIKGAENE